MSWYIDMYDDMDGTFLRKVINQYPSELVNYVKGIKMTKKASIEAEDMFADPEGKKFPLHDREHTALSFIYADAQDAPEEVMGRIKLAAKFYKIPEELLRREEIKEASSDNAPDFVVKTRSDAKKLLRMVESNLKNLNYEERKELLRKVASFVGPDESPLVATYLGVRQPSPVSRMRAELEKRAGLAEESGKRKAAKVYKLVRDNVDQFADKPIVLSKLAEAVEEIDRMSQLMEMYDRAIADPYMTFFMGAPKVARMTIVIGGSEIPAEILNQIPPEVWEDFFGRDIAATFVTPQGIDIQAFQSLLKRVPPEIIALLEKYLSRLG